MDPGGGSPREREASPEPGGPQTMFDIAERLPLGQRAQVTADADPLRELAQLRPRQLRLELRLAGEDDLQELPVRGLERGQNADLLERLHAHVLCLIDDDHDALALATRGQEMLAEHRHQLAPRRSAPLEAEAVQDRADELGLRQMGIEQQHALRLRGQFAEQRAAQRRLARSTSPSRAMTPLPVVTP